MIFHKLSSCQIRIIALCFLIVAIDGFDTAANVVGHSGLVMMFGGAILARDPGDHRRAVHVPQGPAGAAAGAPAAPEASGGIDTAKVALQH